MENTNQLNQMEFKIAPFYKRLLAYLIDSLPIVLILFMFSNLNIIIHELALLISIIYSLLTDSSSLQGTFGKKIMRIKVVDELGQRITFKKSVLRNLFKIVSSIPFYLGFIWILFNKKRRGWHDMVAKTYIIERN
jgi:uncharacterized RDD family membrane protein YckC